MFMGGTVTGNGRKIHVFRILKSGRPNADDGNRGLGDCRRGAGMREGGGYLAAGAASAAWAAWIWEALASMKRWM